MTYEIDPETPGTPDHAAPATETDAVSRALRTFVQGLLTDVLLAVVLVVSDALRETTETIDWRLLGLATLKTAAMTAASYVMRKVAPPA